ncbi:DNA breaking-rejoining enzyme [Suillus placidus]|uniref:DNA breaking-rejoining enzyme n=1 Tax=Suillus placidus TaxID=48579 RepID=A0A9P7CY71_9AGAM|nr:DNA breaking-rejoining enzyme [Suillus placidus]KAG1769891.1 DNA breaking-rejoining enzyme [Suillus placidus]
MDTSDSLNLDGTTKLSTKERGSYGYAQKMWAAMTYAFRRLQVEVSSYMCSLRRHKAGEVAVSAHAITSCVLKKMYHFNNLPENLAIHDYWPRGRGDTSESLRWAGGRMRHCLHAIYTIAFLCMLHSDEVLKIQAHDIHFFSNGLVLTLPFRKTHQNRDIKPFWLWLMPTEEEHLCAIQAIAEWTVASQIMTRYLFRKFASGDRVTEANHPIMSERFLELFHNNLLDIGLDPSSYGTHSFWRGGCQYLHAEHWWPLHRICGWGGWSLEFTNLTIIKYLISHNDNATEPREQFFNPDRRPSIKCPCCGRSCLCA